MASESSESLYGTMEGWLWKRVPEPTDSNGNRYVSRMLANAFRSTKYQRRWVTFDGEAIRYYSTRPSDSRSASSTSTPKGSIAVTSIEAVFVTESTAATSLEKGRPANTPVLHVQCPDRVFKFCPDEGGNGGATIERWRAALECRLSFDTKQEYE